MRDPERIDEVLKIIEEIWKASPDLRLTQLILNCAMTNEHFRNDGDMYHVEDDDLLERLFNLYLNKE